MEAIDFAKTHKALYTATRKIAEIKAESGTYFAVEGKGAPGGKAFTAAIQALYSTVYTIKFTCKYTGEIDFKVSKLECLYLSDLCKTKRENWHWRLLVRVPDAITTKHLTAARKALKERNGADASTVKRIRFKEGRALQTLHVGPYEQLGVTCERLTAYAKEQGLTVQMPYHEIYLSDPHRTAPAKLKTIVRLPVKKA